MINCNCDCRCAKKFDCTTLAIIASVVIGIVTAFLRYTAVITLPVAFLWVTFGIALFFLIVLFARSVFGQTQRTACSCSTLPLLLFAVLVTLLTAVILLGITFVATSIVGAIISGLLLAAFSLIFTTAACFIKCSANCNRE